MKISRTQTFRRTYLLATAATDNESQNEGDATGCLDALQPLVNDDMRSGLVAPQPRHGRRDEYSAVCSAHCIGPSCKPANMNVWWAYRSEASAYARHPVCPDDARLTSSAKAFTQLTGDTDRKPPNKSN
ncbi:hypothetical protein ACVBGC_35115 [Burkholderia stagnalis]